MGNTDFFKNKITGLSNTYKAIASLSLLSIAKNDIEQVKKLHNELNKTETEIINLINLYQKDNLVEEIEDIDFENLPDYLVSLKLVNSYKKNLSLKYTTIKSENKENIIILNKMSIDFNYKEEIPYLNIARILYENGNYPEAAELCEYITAITDTAPAWNVLGDIYRKTGQYGKSIGAYNIYLKLNENDEDAKKTLNEIYEEVFK